MATPADKYRINALAKDLGVKTKEITDLLSAAGKGQKSPMTALEPDELSLVFEHITQRHEVNIEEFFKQYEEKKKARKAKEQAERAQAEAARQAERDKRKPQSGGDRQPQQKRSRTEVRVVDTRGTSNVNPDKYDEKLDNFVPEAANINVGKQKIKKKNTRDQGPDRRGGGRGRNDQRRTRGQQPAFKPKPVQLSITVPDEITVGELASRMKISAGEVIKKLMSMGLMVTVNQVIDYDSAFLVADEFKIKVSKEVVLTIEDRLFDESADKEEDLKPRAPVVVVMGHVDHGKTSLLDAIRNTNVTAGEAGGITQHIGAYRVTVQGKEITFLDTPGHEAFTAMRARGANLTDVAVLVVAADDGIMPQTVEAINHARVKQELTQYELVPEEWGGDTICVPVSAVKGTGVNELLEMIILSSDMMELKANPSRAAKGVVIEAKLDKGRGAVATVLVQNGTLKNGDIVIAGTATGRVRMMTNDKGERVNEAGPSFPVEIMGLSEAPNAGDVFNAVADERMARELVEQRKHQEKEEAFKKDAKVNLDDLFNQIGSGIKTFNIIVKADVQGSAEAVKQSLVKLSNDEVKVAVIHAGVGGITESDVMLAAASNALIIGFNIRPDKKALDAAARDGVDIRTYRIIYECIEEIEAAMKGMLAPKFRENVIGHAEVRQTIRVPNVGTIAGSYVTDGKIARHALIRVLRDNVVIFEDKIASLKRFKDDAREVAQSFECGVGLEKFNDIKVGDVLEAYVMEEIEQ